MIKIILLITITVFCASQQFGKAERIRGSEFKAFHAWDLGDLNGDGKLDVIMIGHGRDRGWVQYNIGTKEKPAFGLADRININLSESEPVFVAYVQSLQAVDWNKDGKTDLIMQPDNRSNDPSNYLQYLLTNTGTPENHILFRGHSIGGVVRTANAHYKRSSFAADWDNDGKQDLLVYADRNDSFSVWFKNDSSEDSLCRLDSSAYHPFKTAPGHLVKPYNLFVTDWNNDGFKDLIGSGSGCSYKLRIWMGTANRDSVAPPVDIAGIHTGARAVVRDFNNDGKSDVVVMDTLMYLRVYWNIGTSSAPSFAAADTIYGGDFGQVDDRTCPFFVDWNNDGLQDMVLGGLYWSYCGGGYPYHRLFLNNGTAEKPHYDLGKWVRFKTSNGSSAAPVINNDTRWVGLSSPVVTDFNNDGYWDIVSTCNASAWGPKIVYIAYGDSATQKTSVFGIPTLLDIAPLGTGMADFVSLQLADYNHDGLKDILFSSTDAMKLRAYLNVGSLTAPSFTATDTVQLAPLDSLGLYQGLAWGDISGDGKEDLVVGAYGKLRYFENNGTLQKPLFNTYDYLKHKDSSAHVTIGPVTTEDGCWVTRRISQGASGTLVDIDNDGDLDLLAGYRLLDDGPTLLLSSEIFLFRNTTKVPSTSVDSRKSNMAQNCLVASPNPFKPIANIHLPTGLREATIDLFSMDGKRIATVKAESGVAKWNATGYAPGVYIATIRSTRNILKTKLLLMH
ncbi:MAG: T9SS type A sorting domain-containing protein [Fibrobacteres bacterium]|nr:T9SS type A sorting domain-containing protein [Fibrobacterota bacterium]